MTDMGDDIESDAGKDEPAKNPARIHRRLVRGSVLMVVMRWTLRGIGLVSTIILARLLEPNDFGLVAMAMIMVGFLETVLDAGIDFAIIRTRRPDRAFLDTAWTIKIIQGVAIAGVIFVMAPSIAWYFREPQVTDIMRVLAFRALISGFQNIGTVYFRINLNFEKEFIYWVLRRMMTFSITVSLAFVLLNYWALVIGMVLGPLFGVLLSYWMHPYRPRLSVAAFRQLWSFSVWMLVRDSGEYVFRRIDELVVGRIAASDVMGNYYLAKDVPARVAGNIVAPVSRALYPGYTKFHDDPENLARVYLAGLAAVAMICLPLGAGMSSIADPMVDALLGDRWSATKPLIRILALAIAINEIRSSIAPLLISLNRPMLVASITWAVNGALAIAIPLAGRDGDATAIANTMLVASTCYLVLMLWQLQRVLPITWISIAQSIWRPAIATVMMWFAVNALVGLLDEPAILALTAEIVIGAMAYTSIVILSWLISGRPEGPETYVLSRVPLVRRITR